MAAMTGQTIPDDIERWEKKGLREDIDTDAEHVHDIYVWHNFAIEHETCDCGDRKDKGHWNPYVLVNGKPLKLEKCWFDSFDEAVGFLKGALKDKSLTGDSESRDDGIGIPENPSSEHVAKKSMVSMRARMARMAGEAGWKDMWTAELEEMEKAKPKVTMLKPSAKYESKEAFAKGLLGDMMSCIFVDQNTKERLHYVTARLSGYAKYLNSEGEIIESRTKELPPDQRKTLEDFSNLIRSYRKDPTWIGSREGIDTVDRLSTYTAPPKPKDSSKSRPLADMPEPEMKRGVRPYEDVKNLLENANEPYLKDLDKREMPMHAPADYSWFIDAYENPDFKKNAVLDDSGYYSWKEGASPESNEQNEYMRNLNSILAQLRVDPSKMRDIMAGPEASAIRRYLGLDKDKAPAAQTQRMLTLPDGSKVPVDHTIDDTNSAAFFGKDGGYNSENWINLMTDRYGYNSVPKNVFGDIDSIIDRLIEYLTSDKREHPITSEAELYSTLCNLADARFKDTLGRIPPYWGEYNGDWFIGSASALNAFKARALKAVMQRSGNEKWQKVMETMNPLYNQYVKDKIFIAPTSHDYGIPANPFRHFPDEEFVESVPSFNRTDVPSFFTPEQRTEYQNAFFNALEEAYGLPFANMAYRTMKNQTQAGHWGDGRISQPKVSYKVDSEALEQYYKLKDQLAELAQKGETDPEMQEYVKELEDYIISIDPTILLNTSPRKDHDKEYASKFPKSSTPDVVLEAGKTFMNGIGQPMNGSEDNQGVIPGSNPYGSGGGYSLHSPASIGNAISMADLLKNTELGSESFKRRMTPGEAGIPYERIEELAEISRTPGKDNKAKWSIVPRDSNFKFEHDENMRNMGMDLGGKRFPVYVSGNSMRHWMKVNAVLNAIDTYNRQVRAHKRGMPIKVSGKDEQGNPKATFADLENLTLAQLSTAIMSAYQAPGGYQREVVNLPVLAGADFSKGPVLDINATDPNNKRYNLRMASMQYFRNPEDTSTLAAPKIGRNIGDINTGNVAAPLIFDMGHSKTGYWPSTNGLDFTYEPGRWGRVPPAALVLQALAKIGDKIESFKPTSANINDAISADKSQYRNRILSEYGNLSDEDKANSPYAAIFNPQAIDGKTLDEVSDDALNRSWMDTYGFRSENDARNWAIEVAKEAYLQKKIAQTEPRLMHFMRNTPISEMDKLVAQYPQLAINMGRSEEDRDDWYRNVITTQNFRNAVYGGKGLDAGFDPDAAWTRYLKGDGAHRWVNRILGRSLIENADADNKDWMQGKTPTGAPVKGNREEEPDISFKEAVDAGDIARVFGISDYEAPSDGEKDKTVEPEAPAEKKKPSKDKSSKAPSEKKPSNDKTKSKGPSDEDKARQAEIQNHLVNTLGGGSVKTTPESNQKMEDAKQDAKYGRVKKSMSMRDRIKYFDPLFDTGVAKADEGGKKTMEGAMPSENKDTDPRIATYRSVSIGEGKDPFPMTVVDAKTGKVLFTLKE